jgi:hypothetical protein
MEALESVLCNPEGRCCIIGSEADRAIVDAALDELKKTLAQPEQGEPDYKTLAIQLQQQRTWVGLTDEEMYKLWLSVDEESDRMAFGEAVQAKLKEKNT